MYIKEVISITANICVCKKVCRSFIVIDGCGNKFWYKNDKYHRENGPAVEKNDGTKEWWVNGLLHRLNGPAVEWNDGLKQWWVNGKEYTQIGFKKYLLVKKLSGWF